MVLAAVFHGDPVELRVLLAAVERNCTCSDPEVVTGHCPAHRALLDQRLLDGLVFARYLTERLIFEEFRSV